MSSRVRTLDISTHLQDSARAYAARQIARGLPPTALEQWIAEQRDRGAVIRCKSEIPPTAECIGARDRGEIKFARCASRVHRS